MWHVCYMRVNVLYFMALTIALVHAGCNSESKQDEGGVLPPMVGKPKKTPIPPDPYYSTDPTFEPFIYDFKVDAERYSGGVIDVTNLRVTFGDTRHRGGRVVGYCEFLNNGQNHVAIKKEFWDSASDYDRISLLYHELGHCALFRAHRIQFRVDNLYPISLMYSFLVREIKFMPFFDDYMQEMFTQGPYMKRTAGGETVCDVES